MALNSIIYALIMCVKMKIFLQIVKRQFVMPAAPATEFDLNFLWDCINISLVAMIAF